MTRVLGCIAMLMATLVSHAAIAKEVDLPEAVTCNLSFANGQLGQISLIFRNDARVVRLMGPDWQTNVAQLKVGQRESFDERIHALTISDSSNKIFLVFSPIAKFSDTFRVLMWGDLTGETANLPIGTGVCATRNDEFNSDLNRQNLTTHADMKFLLGMRPRESGRCLAINRDGVSFSFIAKPDGNYLNLDFADGAPYSGTIRVARVLQPPTQTDYANFAKQYMPPLLAENWLYSAERKTRGSFQIYGRDFSKEWMALITLWAIDGEETAETIYASHCGGFAL